MSLSFTLFTGQKIKSQGGRHPIKLRAYFGKDRYISTGEFAFPKEWDKKNQRLTSHANNFEARNAYLRKFMDEAYELLREMPTFDFNKFKAKLTGTNRLSNINVYDFLNEHIDLLNKQEKFARAEDFCSLRSRIFGSKRCKKFSNKNLVFTDIDYPFLKRILAHWRADGVKGGACNLMKHFRKLYREADDQGLIPETHKYPFTKINISGLQNKVNPRPLTMDELKALFAIPIWDYPKLVNWFYIFQLSYYLGGMAFKDMCYLRYDTHIVDDHIVYVKGKTSETMPPVHIDDNITTILTQLNDGTGYMIPVFNDFHKTEWQKYNRYRKKQGHYNMALKELAKIAGIKSNLTAYVARHTMTNVLIKKGATLLQVQAVCNHKKIETTMHYVKTISNNETAALHKLLKLD